VERKRRADRPGSGAAGVVLRPRDAVPGGLAWGPGGSGLRQRAACDRALGSGRHGSALDPGEPAHVVGQVRQRDLGGGAHQPDRPCARSGPCHAFRRRRRARRASGPAPADLRPRTCARGPAPADLRTCPVAPSYVRRHGPAPGFGALELGLQPASAQQAEVGPAAPTRCPPTRRWPCSRGPARRRAGRRRGGRRGSRRSGGRMNPCVRACGRSRGGSCSRTQGQRSRSRLRRAAACRPAAVRRWFALAPALDRPAPLAVDLARARLRPAARHHRARAHRRRLLVLAQPRPTGHDDRGVHDLPAHRQIPVLAQGGVEPLERAGERARARPGAPERGSCSR
jgi:hypothetical protein